MASGLLPELCEKDPGEGCEVAKKIEAIIREEKLNDVKDALRAIGIVGMNISEIRGRGRQGGVELVGRAGSYQVDFLPKLQLNIILRDHEVQRAVTTICRAADTNCQGDGIICVYPVEEVVRIRTRERGSRALTYPRDMDGRVAEEAQEDNDKTARVSFLRGKQGKPGNRWRRRPA
jgi:nitrogen regulatory protein P-II 1